MRLRTVLWLGALAPLALAEAQVCKPMQADRILARDLAAVLPDFARIPPDTWLANMPPPGSQRTFHHAELLSLAERYSLRISPDASACFERAMEPLDRQRVLDAMRTALQIPDAHIELAETSLYPVPVGRIEFGLARLGRPASPDQRAPVLWRGDVVYGENHRFEIWARVRILAHRSRVKAAEELKPGRPIERWQLRVEMDEGFPLVQQPAPTMEQFVGMVPLRPIAAGAALLPTLVSPRNDVNRGDLVEIEVRSGAARLVLTARAESGGRDGETIMVRNLGSNRVFAAQVAGKDKAIVLTDALKAE